MRYPIAEIFSSLQGEGAHVGTKMLFVRLAGCTVGTPFTTQEKALLPVLNTPGHTKCTAWNGASFECDTLYKATESLTVDDICGHLDKEKIVCITGGEPFMHDLKPLATELLRRDMRVHFETSGTWLLHPVKHLPLSDGKVWITVSPKKGYLEQALLDADEIKILVHRESFDRDEFCGKFGKHLHKVFLQPINGVETIDRDNLRFVMGLIDDYPETRLSMQLHKWLEVR